MNVKNLSNRVVLITGAGSGMGRATALLCARRGARLAICDRLGAVKEVDGPGDELATIRPTAPLPRRGD